MSMAAPHKFDRRADTANRIGTVAFLTVIPFLSCLSGRPAGLPSFAA